MAQLPVEHEAAVAIAAHAGLGRQISELTTQLVALKAENSALRTRVSLLERALVSARERSESVAAAANNSPFSVAG